MAIQLPRVSGYRIMLEVPAPKSKVGSIHLPDEALAKEGIATVVGKVVAMGPDCYKDLGKFPSGPWCQPGDWVMFRSYSGTRVKHGEQEYRFINDDTVEAVVDNPMEWTRV